MSDDFDIDEMLELAKQSANRKSVSYVADKLRAGFVNMNKRFALLPGMLVTWKPGLCNKRYPEEGQPAIVMSVLDVPIMNREDGSASSPYFREPLGVVVGVLDPDDGTFMTFYADDRRLMPFYGEMEAEDAP